MTCKMDATNKMDMTCKVDVTHQMEMTCKLDLTGPTEEKDKDEDDEVRMEITSAQTLGGGTSMDVTCRMDKTKNMHLTCQIGDNNR